MREQCLYHLCRNFREAALAYVVRTVQAKSECLSRVVHHGLEFLEMLSARHEICSILLLLIYILGCSALEPEYRQKILAGYKKLKRYSNFGNIDASKRVVGIV